MSGLDDTLAQNYKADWAVIKPYLQQLMGYEAQDTNSTRLVDAAKRQMQRTALGIDGSVNQRQMSRAQTYLTPSQRLAMNSLNSVNAAASNTANMNTARVDQYEANTGALNRLVAQTNAMKKGSAATLGGIAQNEAQRRMQKDAQYHANKQAKYGALGSIAGLGVRLLAGFL
ncbi:hypothetical protein HPC37_02800 [Pasteurellaceae bacterium 20609_3]|uniref:hypothetical protein n=1 Tax=Spirabiliibacterium mucosae TaxID=28156 RepID=UPI001AADE150|nr:hypothetical protein [Spirabiliibacterium mucosae]MBE2897783.1 hypothetical protein [Spirabiliibacterium mucosae]